jgi:hypothetical protein
MQDFRAEFEFITAIKLDTWSKYYYGKPYAELPDDGIEQDFIVGLLDCENPFEQEVQS